MKLNKRILKEIVKECLIEILAEGIVTDKENFDTPKQKRAALKESITQKSESNKAEIIAKAQHASFRKPSYLDNISFPASDSSAQTQNSASNIQETKVMNLTKDPIMNEIFADTAATTLREQQTAESRRNHVPSSRQDRAAAIVDKTPLDDLFGGAADKWASLAFAASTPGK